VIDWLIRAVAVVVAPWLVDLHKLDGRVRDLGSSVDELRSRIQNLESRRRWEPPADQ